VRSWRPIFFCSGGGEFCHGLAGRSWQRRGREHNGNPAYKDGLKGPEFDKKLRDDAVLVFSYVKKEHGYTKDFVSNISGSPKISKAQAEALKRTFDPKLPQGQFEYSYLWEKADKCPGAKDLKDSILKAIDVDYRPKLESVVKDAKINLDTFNGQLLFGDKGLDLRAGLDGKQPMK
jgi:hypothetical protein